MEYVNGSSDAARIVHHDSNSGQDVGRNERVSIDKDEDFACGRPSAGVCEPVQYFEPVRK